MKKKQSGHFERVSSLKRIYRAAASRYPSIRTIYQSTAVPIFAWVRAMRSYSIRDSAGRAFGRIKLWAAAELPFFSDIGSRAQGREIVMLVVSDLRIDPRVEREARALADAGYYVHIICPDPTLGGGGDLKLDWGAHIDIVFIHWSAASFLTERPGYVSPALFVEACRYRPLAYHAHDLNTCYAALAAARKTGAHLVVDFHEWTSENVHWSDKKKAWTPYPPRWKKQLQRLERRLLKEASAVVTVCNSIADALAKELGDGRHVRVIRNIPRFSAQPTRDYPSLKEQLHLKPESFVVLYQGGTGATRLLEPIVEALQYAPRATLVIRGPSLEIYGPKYREIAECSGTGDRLVLASGVPSHDVVAAARGADVGIWSLPALCRNFTYALPNKIFEYLAAGLPVLAANYPETRALIEAHNVGITFDPYDPKSIARAINRFIDDQAFIEACRNNAAPALAEIDAETEWRKLVEVYNALPRTSCSDTVN